MSLREELKLAHDEQERKRNEKGRNVPWRRKWRIAKRRVGGAALTFAAPTVLRFLATSWTIERNEPQAFDDAVQRGGCLVASWHGRMLPAIPLHDGTRFDVLVSPSDDGEMVARILRKNGYRVLRGSSNRSGAKALREMLRMLQADRSVVITPDGPRGPRHSMNIGLGWLASRTGRPVFTVGIAADPARHLKSWDRFTIPRRRARIVACYGGPFHLHPNASIAEIEEFSRQIRQQLIDSERRAFAKLEAPIDWRPEDEAALGALA